MTPPWELHLADAAPRRIERCLVMGILNATPDSFSDGGVLADPDRCDQTIRAMIAAGVDILDVGGESTRPGHQRVDVEEEIARVAPMVEAIRRIDADIPISIDTQKAAVAEVAMTAGASLVNDVSGLGDEEMAEVVLRAECSVVLMRRDDIHGDIVAGCRTQLDAAVRRARGAGIPRERIIVDPGLGFGDHPGAHTQDNLALIDHLDEYARGYPVLIGASRKRFVRALAADGSSLLQGSVAVALRAVQAGAAIVRVHDVAETVQALSGYDRRGHRPPSPQA